MKKKGYELYNFIYRWLWYSRQHGLWCDKLAFLNRNKNEMFLFWRSFVIVLWGIWLQTVLVILEIAVCDPLWTLHTRTHQAITKAKNIITGWATWPLNQCCPLLESGISLGMRPANETHNSFTPSSGSSPPTIKKLKKFLFSTGRWVVNLLTEICY